MSVNLGFTCIYIYTYRVFHLHHSCTFSPWNCSCTNSIRNTNWGRVISCRPKQNNPVNSKGGAWLWWAQNDEWTILLAVWWCWRFISAQFEGCVISNMNSSLSHRYEGSTGFVVGVCNLFPPSKNKLKRRFWQQRTSPQVQRKSAEHVCIPQTQQIWIQTFLHISANHSTTKYNSLLI